MIRRGPPVQESVDATVDRHEATSVRWDVIIIGAGPAGAAAAVRLADGGRRVLLVDRCGMPRAKVCGCCLSSVAVSELFAIGLPPDRLGGLPRTHVRLVAASGEARLPLAGWTLSRETLDAAIVHRAIMAGAAWLPSTSVSVVEDTATGVVVTARDADGRELRLSAVHAVVASGLGCGVRIRSDGRCCPRSRSRRASRIGVGATLPADAATVAAGELVMQVAAEGYCGIVRLEDGRIDVAAAVDPATVGRHGSAVAAVAALFGARQAKRGGAVVDVAGSGIRFVGTPPLTHALPAFAGRWRRIHRVGDAAAYVEPFTGEGIGWALVGGRSLAEAMLAHRPGDSAATAEAIAIAHERAVARRLVRSQQRCLRVASVVRHPSLVAAAVSAARLFPPAAAWAVPLVVGSEPVGDADGLGRKLP